MAKTRAVKEKAVGRLIDQLKTGKGIVLADFTGLLVKELQQLRAELRRAGIYYEVVKKTLLKRSLTEAGLKDVPVDEINGSISLAVSQDDEVLPAKTLVDFSKKFEKLKVLGGVMQAQYIDEAKVKSLAQLPSKEELLAQVVGTIRAPLSGLVNVLQGNLRGLVQVLKARAEKGN
jgi:large subunit ribosomal protein L10